MTLAAPKISRDVLYDMFEIVESQIWMREYLDQLTELWNICEVRDEQVFLKELIKRFVILDGILERKAYAALVEQVGNWGLSYSTAWIVAAANATEIDGSTASLQKLKNKIEPIESWHSRLLPNIPVSPKFVASGQTVVLFDDFIGSGKKMIDKGNWLLRVLGKEGITDINLIYLSVAGMSFGVERIIQETGRDAFAAVSLRKGISDFVESDEAESHKSLMRRIESRLSEYYKNKKLVDYSLGFNESEALYCVENDNCPNNVFPVFWWAKLKNGAQFKTILNRAG